MEDTLNEWAVAPLINWNFNSGNYPKIKMMPLKDNIQQQLISIFEKLISKDPQTYVSAGFANKLSNEVANTLGLEIKENIGKDAFSAFESGKRKEFDKKKKPAIPTTDVVKKKIKKRAVRLQDDPYFLEKFEAMGRSFAIGQLEENK